MYQDADFISLPDDLFHALLEHELPRIRGWAFDHLAATRPYEQLDHAWIDAALRRSPEDASEIYRIDFDVELATHHLDAASVHLSANAAAALRAFVDLDQLIALAPDTHAYFTRQTRAWLERDPHAYLDRRLHEDRPALSACELAAWLLYAPHIRPKTLANRLLAADLATFQDAAFGLLHALGLRLAGSLRGEQGDRERAIARLINLMRHNIRPVHDPAPLSASTQKLLDAGQLPASLIDSSIHALSPQRSPALAIALRDALASAKKRPPHAAALRLVLAACAQRDLLIEATPFDDDPTCFVWRWHLTPAERLPALLAATAALDDARMATLTDMIEEHARSLYICGVMDALLPLLLARPTFDVARLLDWPLAQEIPQPSYTLPTPTTLLHTLAQSEPDRWLDALKRAPRAHLVMIDLVFFLTAELHDPSWTNAQRMHNFERLFGHVMALPTSKKEFVPSELREELAIMLGHLPTLRDALARLRTEPEPDRAYVDVESCALAAHHTGALESLPLYVQTRLELPRAEHRPRMVKQDDGTWQLLLRCAQCHAYAYQPLGRLLLYSPHYIEAPDDNMIVAPAPRCPRCDARDAYIISRDDLAAMHPTIKAEYKARASILDVREAPLTCEPPDEPPLTIRRVDEALALAQRCVARDPDDPARWSLLAEMHQIAMSYEQAVEAFDHALRLKPDDIVLTLRRITTLALLKRDAEVLAALDMLAGWLLRPDDPLGLRPQIARLFTQLAILHARDKTLHIKTYAPAVLDDAIAVSALRHLDRLEELLTSHSLDALRLSDEPAPARGPLHKLLADTPLHTVVHAAPKAGRNDPCPCGSGKKYKKCHGAEG